MKTYPRMIEINHKSRYRNLKKQDNLTTYCKEKVVFSRTGKGSLSKKGGWKKGTRQDPHSLLSFWRDPIDSGMRPEKLQPTRILETRQ